jgi:cell division protein FtsW (lipid II flippase)
MGIIGVFAVEMMWEKHLSGTMIIAAIGMVIIFFAGANLFWFGLGGCGIAAAAIWYVSSHRYAMDRIKIWLDPFIDPLGDGWQGVQAQLAIGSGGFWGLGLGQSIQKHLYLPEPANDFIFSVWCEEMGFVGAVLVILLFAALLLNLLWSHALSRSWNCTALAACAVFLLCGIAILINNTGALAISLNLAVRAIAESVTAVALVHSLTRKDNRKSNFGETEH